MIEPVDTCAVCPRLCRHACPVAEGTGREAAVPAQLAGVLRAWRDGVVDEGLASQAASLCTDCGACSAACHLHVPLPEALAEARAALHLVSAPADLAPVLGEGGTVALLTDHRDWSEPLSRLLGEPVARWSTRDRLGWQGRGHPGWSSHLSRIRSEVGRRRVVVADQFARAALDAAGCETVSLHELIDRGGWTVSCRTSGQACCGGGGILGGHHASDAEQLALSFPVSGPLVDVGCAAHLRGSGRGVRDVIDVLEELVCDAL